MTLTLTLTSNPHFEGEVVEKNGELGIVASFNKRYITLAPVAGVVGLAFQLKDPKGLLKGTGHEGITIALLERDHEGNVTFLLNFYILIVATTNTIGKGKGFCNIFISQDSLTYWWYVVLNL